MEYRRLKQILGILEFLKVFIPLVALLYLITWVSQFISESLYDFLNLFFHHLPDLFNNFVYITVDLFGEDVPMGYPYIALIIILFMPLVFNIDKHIKKNNNLEALRLENEKKDRILQEDKRKRKIEEIKKKQREKQLKEEIQTIKNEKAKEEMEEEDNEITAFYGLLTFELKYLNELNEKKLDIETAKKLKHEYTKILVEKLKQKYGSINYAASDKVFFICNNISLFNLFVRDIVKLNKIIATISTSQNIKTALKACFYSSPNAKVKQACNILIRINNLNYLNKIIVSKDLQLKFDNQLIKCFDFCPIGTVKLTKTETNEKDIDMELFYLKTLE